MVTDNSKDIHVDAGFYRKLAEILVGVKKAIKTFQFYAGNHPARAQALAHTHKQVTELLAQRAPLALQISHEGFFADGEPVGQDHPFLRGFAPELTIRGIQGIRFLHGLRLEDLQLLTELLTLEAAEAARQGGGRAFLQGRGASTVEVDDLHVEFLEMGAAQPESALHEDAPGPEPLPEEAPPPAEPDPPTTEMEAESPPETPEEESPAVEEQKEEEQPDLETLIAELKKTDRPARYETITEELSRLGREAHARGESQPCLRVMTALALELHPDNPKAETITRFARWTLRPLLDDTGPDLVIEGFCHGGTVPEDDVAHLLLTVKDEMAGAVVERLVIEKEGATRRKLEDLLIRMGDAVLPAVRGALKAPSWETVRRVFPVLPRIAGTDVAEILKRLFRHYDPRIREESARLLGQMHADFADDLLLRALSDAESSVRQAAMAVLGGLKVKASVPPLRRIAEEPPGTRDVEEQKIAIAALGAIGDREALPTLIGLLHQKRWFQRRTTEKLRIAAAYALGKFGGPEARTALQAVGQSARPALKHACEVALKNPHSEEPEAA